VGLSGKRKNKVGALVIIAAAVSLGTAVFFSFDMMRTAFEALLENAIESAGFIVKTININGASKKNTEIIMEGLAIRNGESIFKVSTKDIYKYVSSKSFVKSVIVSKNLPNILNINIIEKEPIAIFQQNSKFFLIDREGAIIEEVSSRRSGLPVVIGDDANLHAMQIVDKISRFKQVMPRVEHMMFVRKRRWDIVLRGGTIVKLPKENVDQAIKTLSDLSNKELIKGAKTIDLRIEGSTVISGIKSQNSNDNHL
jgi:cell division protein FtsQ